LQKKKNSKMKMKRRGEKETECLDLCKHVLEIIEIAARVPVRESCIEGKTQRSVGTATSDI